MDGGKVGLKQQEDAANSALKMGFMECLEGENWWVAALPGGDDCG